eukprot:11211875-Lingulodinium_polyedra.AAC.1
MSAADVALPPPATNLELADLIKRPGGFHALAQAGLRPCDLRRKPPEPTLPAADPEEEAQQAWLATASPPPARRGSTARLW